MEVLHTFSDRLLLNGRLLSEVFGSHSKLSLVLRDTLNWEWHLCSELFGPYIYLWIYTYTYEEFLETRLFTFFSLSVQVLAIQWKMQINVSKSKNLIQHHKLKSFFKEGSLLKVSSQFKCSWVEKNKVIATWNIVLSFWIILPNHQSLLRTNLGIIWVLFTLQFSYLRIIAIEIISEILRCVKPKLIVKLFQSISSLSWQKTLIWCARI